MHQLLIASLIFYFLLLCGGTAATALTKPRCSVAVSFSRDPAVAEMLPAPVLNADDHRLHFRSASAGSSGLLLLPTHGKLGVGRLDDVKRYGGGAVQARLSFDTAADCNQLVSLTRTSHRDAASITMPGFVYATSSEQHQQQPWSWTPLGSVLITLHYDSTLSATPRAKPQARSKRTYMLFDPWHTYAVWAAKTYNATATSIETVIRTGYPFESIYPPGGEALARSFFWQSTPASGLYCFYRKRAGQDAWRVPEFVCGDNATIAAAATRQARMLTALGVDVIVIDGTNLGQFSDFADVLQLRPAVVLAQEFAKPPRTSSRGTR
jgi:hypothetical protein